MRASPSGSKPIFFILSISLFGMITIQASRLIQLGIDIFMAQGLGEVDAGFLVNSLVEANLAGHDSHGAHYYARYSERISEGFIRLDVEPKIIKETPGTVYIDGQWGMGQLTARRMTEIAVEKAKIELSELLVTHIAHRYAVCSL